MRAMRAIHPGCPADVWQAAQLRTLAMFSPDERAALLMGEVMRDLRPCPESDRALIRREFLRRASNLERCGLAVEFAVGDA